MATMFHLNAEKISPRAGEKLIRAEETGHLFTAVELIAAWRDREAELLKAAEEVYRQRREEGFQQGLAEGRDEYSAKIMEAVMSSVEYIEGLEGTLVKVVGEAVRKTIGEMDSDEVIVRVVRQALTSLRGEKKLLIRVSPREEKPVRDDLAALLSRRDSGGGYIDLIADPRLNKGECVLESDLGIVEASLETQLRNLEKAMIRRVKNTGA
ncbi:MAG: HrpE/YscL family type III secretion apparatus protein [Deltaproteobacteria bacterium]|jgi:type III secretion protein L|nr:HrpE/YscL family type III secretion apparatus protein [Deltaproteobacteria bacterium]